MPDPIADLDLYSLFHGRIGLTRSEGGHLAECAVVCYHKTGKTRLPNLRVTGRYAKEFALTGPAVTRQMRRTYADAQEATEYGACGIAALVLEVCAGLTILERAPKGEGGFDYYLAPFSEGQNTDSENFFGSATATLEVSGILQGTETDSQYRLNEKIRQVQNRASSLPVFLAIVTFSISSVRIEQQ